MRISDWSSDVCSSDLIVTNNHVVQDGEKVEVTLNSRETYEAEVIGTDPGSDLALLKINSKDLPFIPYGNSDAVQVGEWVLAVRSEERRVGKEWVVTGRFGGTRDH